MTVDERPTPLASYVEDCEALYEWLGGIVEDLRYRQEEGGTVRYAVDFSEIFAFLLPHRVPQEMRAFRSYGVDEGRAAQHVAGATLFYGLPSRGFPEKAIILAPYAVELEEFVAGLPRAEADHIAFTGARALREVHRLQRDPQFARVKQLILQVGQGREKYLSDAEEQELVRFAEQEGAKLVQLLQDLNCDPRGRLRALAEEERFDDLSSCVSDGVQLNELDPDTVKWWEDRLCETRHPDRPWATNHLDAVAMATLKAATKKLEGSKMRLRIVTRSPHMHQSLKEAVAEGRWQKSQENVLRHPLSFAALRMANDSSDEETLRRLRGMCKSVDVFLEAYRESLQSRREGSERHAADLDDYVREIDEQWRTLTSLSSSVTRPVGGLGDAKPDAPSRDIVDILRILVDQRALYDRLTKRIDELANALDRDFQYLGVFVHSQRSDLGRILQQSVKLKTWETASALSSTLHWMPYRVNFYSAEVREYAKLVSAKRSIHLSQVLDWLREAFSAGPDYERLLWIAYLFGLQAGWRLAEMYSELALLEHDPETDPPHAHEGLFFLAFCRRMRADSPRQYREALGLLEQATHAMAKADPECEDARLLAERARLIIDWNERFPRGASAAADWTRPPSITEVAEVCKRALAVVGKDVALRAQLHNDLCYYYLLTSEEDSREQAREQMNELVAVQRETEPDERAWAPCIIDTVAIARWRLRDDSFTADDHRKLIEQLGAVSSSEGITLWQRELMKRHLDEIQSALEE